MGRLITVIAVTLCASSAGPARADRSSEDPGPRTIVLSRLWLPRVAIDPGYYAGADVRGVARNESDRVRGADRGAGFDTHARTLRAPSSDLSWRVSSEMTSGALDARNLDEAALLARYPGTLPEDLIGGVTALSTDTRAEAAGALDTLKRVSIVLRATDRRLRDRPLGAGATESLFRGDYAANLSWQPSPTLRLTAGGRYDRETVDNAGLSAWYLPSAARDRRRDETVSVLTGVWQPAPRHQLHGAVDVSAYRDDWVPANGIDTPAHLNLDTYQRWGNHPFRVRRREHRLHAELSWRAFADGVVRDDDAHHLMLGASVDHAWRDDDETRTGGFTFVDEVPLSADGTRPPSVDEADRDSWLLLSSDRGDELHAATSHGSAAVWLSDRMEIGSRAVLDAGVRLEHFRGGFAEQGRSWSAMTVSPRLSGRVRLSQDGATALFAAAGRHAQRPDETFVLRDRRGAAYSPLEYWDWTGAPDQAVLPGLDDPSWFRRSQFPAFVGDVADDARHPHLDRAVLGASTGLPDDGLELSLRYEYRRYQNQLGLYDANASIYDAASNPAGTYEYATQSFTAPDGGSESIEFLDLRPDAAPALTIGNPPGARRRSHELSLRGRARLHRRLVTTARVRWTQDRGNFDAARGLSLEWRDPSGALSALGNMPGVDRWRADLGVTFEAPARIDLDVDYRLYSGTYYSRVVRVSPTIAPRTFVFDARGRGGYRYPMRHLVTLKLARPLPWYGPGRLRGWIRVRNALGQRPVTGFREQARLFQAVRSVDAPLQVFVGVRHDY